MGKAAQQFKTLKIPVTILRTGMVLSKKGGALEKMKTPIISPLGSGKQYCLGFILTICATYINMLIEKITGFINTDCARISHQ